MNQSISPTDATQSALSDESIFGIPPAADGSWFSEGTAIAASSSSVMSDPQVEDDRSGAKGGNEDLRGLPTPPPSANDPDASVMSMSTTFHRGMVHDGRSPDLILVSLDAVYFHVHINVLHDASGNGFASLLEQLSSTRASSEVSLINVPESAETLNVVLLTIYDKSSADYRPSFEVLVTAVNEFEKYAIDPRRYVKPSLPLFELIRFHMPLHPLEVYSVAGHYELHELAVAASSHLLGYKLNTITDETVSFMGPLYVRRLYELHMNRTEALKKVLVLPPEPHPSISSCSLMDQTKVARAWALSSAYLIWDVRPDMSASFIENTLSQLKQSMACNSCKKRIDERIKRCVIDWSSVKWTI